MSPAHVMFVSPCLTLHSTAYAHHPFRISVIPGLVMIVAELCDLGVYGHILHTPQARPQARPRAVGGGRALPQGGAPRPPGQGLSPAALLLAHSPQYLPPPHLLCGALGYRDWITVHKLSAPRVPFQCLALSLLPQTHRVEIEISRIVS